MFPKHTSITSLEYGNKHCSEKTSLNLAYFQARELITQIYFKTLLNHTPNIPILKNLNTVVRERAGIENAPT